MNKYDLRKLLDLKTENQNVDYKYQVDWDNSPKVARGEIIKDILAFANTADGGRIVFGVRDGDLEPVGMDKKAFTSFDVTKVNNLLKSYSEPIHYCSVFKIVDDGKSFVVIDVPEFSSMPIICKKNLCDAKGRTILQAGAIYIRNNAAESTKISDSNLMNDLLVRAVRRKSTEILSNIETLLKGKRKMQATENVFEDDLKTAENQIQMELGRVIEEHDYGYNQLIIYPSVELSSVFKDSFILRKHFNESQVRYRGWDFPHEQKNEEYGKTYNIENGFHSYTVWHRAIESFCLFQSGLFVWQGVFWEDLDQERYGKFRSLAFIKEIYDVLEYCIFTARFYDIEGVDLDITIKLSLNHCKGRKLISDDPMVWLAGEYMCDYSYPLKKEETLSIAELKADIRGVATKIARGILGYFNYEIADNIIGGWIDKYMKRKF